MTALNYTKVGQASILPPGPISARKGHFIDKYGRTITLKGINLDSSMKQPYTPKLSSHEGDPRDENNIFFEGDTVSFVGRPFPLEEAADHIMRIKSWGFNTIRYLLTWEAIEHGGPGEYDSEFVDYTIKVLRIIQQVGGVYVFLEPHQDVWSRYSGGSGAPLWTFYAAGLDPRKFADTEAALLHNSFDKPLEGYPKMIWTSNYYRLAAATMFTLFFGGKKFAPNAVINGENIQDFLQSHFLKAIEYVWKRVASEFGDDLHDFLFGFETMNEPNLGFIGHPNLDTIPEKQQLRLGSTPTPFQAMKLGMGIACEVDDYNITVFGPKKTGTTLVDPQGKSAWVDDDSYDKKYGFMRDEKWKLGECLFAQNGIWDTKQQILLKPNFFCIDEATGDTIDDEYFVNNFFVDHFKLFKSSIRNIDPSAFVLLQPPVLKIPPRLKHTDLIDDRIIYCPHYYDGMSLMFKTWNRMYNVDTLGIMRGRYSNPIFSIVLGESNIRKCIRNQFLEMRNECIEYLGDIPVLMSETGMPFDMDNKKAYQDGNYSSQTSALDALGFALEGSNMSHTYWCYNHENNHTWGDNWNCEDFSFWSKDFEKFKPVQKIKHLNNYPSINTLHEPSLRFKSDQDSISNATNISFESSLPEEKLVADGVRAVEAIIRPYAASSNGEPISAEFDLKNKSFNFKLDATNCLSSEDTPTLIYIPRWHFSIDDCKVSVSSGFFNFNYNLEVIEWFHESGPQELTVELIKNVEDSCYYSFWFR